MFVKDVVIFLKQQNKKEIQKMKIVIKLLFLMTFVVVTNGCSQQNITENTATESPTNEVFEQETVDLDNLASGEYRITDIPAKITVNEKYHVYSLDNEYTAEMCASQNVDMDKMKTYLELTKEYSNVNMILIPADNPISTTDFEIHIKVKEKGWDVKNLADLSDYEYKQVADALVAGFDTDYTTYETNDTKWVVFDCFISTNQMRYATVLNGKMIYIFGQNKIGPVTEEQRNDLKEIVTSLKFVSE